MTFIKTIFQIIILLTLFIIFPKISFAYIDPGILSILFQSIFAILAGGAVAWVLTPFHVIKSFICKLFKKKDKKIVESKDENSTK